MFRKVLSISLMFIVVSASASLSQEKEYDFAFRKGTKYLNWTLLQLIPSPYFDNDANVDNARIQFGFRWQFIPVSYSFRANKFVSPVQFFMVNPVRRFSGSIELFVQPEVVTSSFRYSGFNQFGVGTGTRFVFPVQEMGENIAASVGAKYTFRKNDITDEDGYPGLEAGVYFFGGMFGLQFNKNFHKNNEYSFGFYIKYF